MTKDDEILLTNWMNSLFSESGSLRSYPRRVIGRHPYVLPDLVVVAEQNRYRGGVTVTAQFYRVAKGKVLDCDEKCLIELICGYMPSPSGPFIWRFEIFTPTGMGHEEAVNRIKTGLIKQKLATA